LERHIKTSCFLKFDWGERNVWITI
jgi:hypothetical protein